MLRYIGPTKLNQLLDEMEVDDFLAVTEADP